MKTLSLFGHSVLLFFAFFGSGCGFDENTAFTKRIYSKADLDVTPADVVTENSGDATQAAAPGEEGSPPTSEMDEPNVPSRKSVDQFADDEDKPIGTDPQNGGEEPEEGYTPVAQIPDQEQTPPSEPSDEGEEEKDDSSETVTEHERGLCAKQFDVATSSIKIAGNQSSMKLSIGSTGIYAFKVSGNQSRLDLNIKSSEETTLRGLCLFVAGNQARAYVNTSVSIGKLVYFGRGNQSLTEINFDQDAILEDASISLSGNQAKLYLNQDSEFSCPIPEIKGNQAEYRCE
jgi:hypothetical protein